MVLSDRPMDQAQKQSHRYIKAKLLIKVTLTVCERGELFNKWYVNNFIEEKLNQNLA